MTQRYSTNRSKMSGSRKVLLFTVILIGTIQVYGHDKPDPGNFGTPRNVENDNDALNYFTAYGYVNRTGQVEEIIDKKKLKELITKFQTKANPSVTGPNVNVSSPQVPDQTPTFTPPTTTTTASAPSTTSTEAITPVYCNGQFDAATEGFDSNSTYLFQGRQVFMYHNLMYDNRSQIAPGYPRLISKEFPGVMDFIDAAMTYVAKPGYRIMYLFKGDKYWRFDNGVRKTGYPKSITQHWRGVPANLDAAFVWSGNGLGHFVKGNQFYRYSIHRGTIDANYPKPFSVWQGVTSPVDAVSTFGGLTYFFQSQHYQVFYESSFQASRQMQTAPAWLGCRTQGLDLLEVTDD